MSYLCRRRVERKTRSRGSACGLRLAPGKGVPGIALAPLSVAAPRQARLLDEERGKKTGHSRYRPARQGTTRIDQARMGNDPASLAKDEASERRDRRAAGGIPDSAPD